MRSSRVFAVVAALPVAASCLQSRAQAPCPGKAIRVVTAAVLHSIHCCGFNVVTRICNGWRARFYCVRDHAL